MQFTCITLLYAFSPSSASFLDRLSLWYDSCFFQHGFCYRVPKSGANKSTTFPDPLSKSPSDENLADDFLVVDSEGLILEPSPRIHGASPVLSFEDGFVVYQSDSGKAYVFDGVDANEYELSPVSPPKDLPHTTKSPLEGTGAHAENLNESESSIESAGPVPTMVAPEMRVLISQLLFRPLGSGLMRQYPPLYMGFNFVPQTRVGYGANSFDSGYYVPVSGDELSPPQVDAASSPAPQPHLFYVIRSSGGTTTAPSPILL